jgi:hypothetical protein
MKPVKTHTVKSASRKKFHLVQEFEDGFMTCTCEYYNFRGFRSGTCSHIKKVSVKNNEKRMEKST